MRGCGAAGLPLPAAKETRAAATTVDSGRRVPMAGCPATFACTESPRADRGVSHYPPAERVTAPVVDGDTGWRPGAGDWKLSN